MSTPNNGGPAFPQHGWSNNAETIKRMESLQGMTLRQWYMGQIAAGDLAEKSMPTRIAIECRDRRDMEAIAKGYAMMADAMIKASLEEQS